MVRGLCHMGLVHVGHVQSVEMGEKWALCCSQS